jgi:hypothetical protein
MRLANSFLIYDGAKLEFFVCGKTLTIFSNYRWLLLLFEVGLGWFFGLGLFWGFGRRHSGRHRCLLGCLLGDAEVGLEFGEFCGK